MPGSPLFERNKPQAYLCYDHHGDGEYYNLSQRLFSSVAELRRDLSLDRELGANDPKSFLRGADQAMAGAQCAVVLCGARTHLDAYVDWEIKAALDRKIGLLAVMLPGNPTGGDGQPTLPERLQDNFDGGYAVVCGWRDLVDGRIDLTHRMAFAASRMAELIRNDRPLRPTGTGPADATPRTFPASEG